MKEDFESFRYKQRYQLQQLKEKQNEVCQRSCNHYYIATSPIKQDKMELTEFEKKLKFLCSAFQHVDSSSDEVINGVIQDYAKDLLDLARNELLKDLPKWKTYEGKLIGNALTCEETIQPVLVWHGYYITINELEKLPKEE